MTYWVDVATLLSVHGLGGSLLARLADFLGAILIAQNAGSRWRFRNARWKMRSGGN